MASALLAAGLVATLGCDDAEDKNKAGAKTAASAPAPAPEPTKPKAKEVPKDVKDFLAWVEKAGPEIAKGPKPADDHPVLGKITCQGEKEAPDFGYCGSSKSGTPRFAAQWPEKEPKIWATHMMRDTAITWLDCGKLGKASVRDSDQGSVVSFRCKHSAEEDLWLRHFVPAGAARNTQVWVFSRDFPQDDPEAAHAPRPALFNKLKE